MQFNLLYQTWIHTELVTTLGPLEWVLNTPSHHRVHHGSNPWCLDKNYGGVLIIWDRLFGTFESEHPDEKITYGLVVPPKTYNIPYLQVFYYWRILKKAASRASWGDAIQTLVRSPGWTPGASRAGAHLPKKKGENKKYDPQLPTIVEVYLLSHFLITVLLQQTLMKNSQNHSSISVLLHMLYLLVTLGNFGALYDGWRGAIFLEAVRCAFFSIWSVQAPLLGGGTIESLIRYYSVISAVIWAGLALFRDNLNIPNNS